MQKYIKIEVFMDCLARIKELLEERNWSMYQLAHAANIPQSTLSNLFIRNNAPTIPTLEKICDALGITIVQFFGGEQNSHTDDERELLLEWRKLPPATRKALISLIKSYHKQ